MDFVLNSFVPDEKWILLGGSMGAIIATCYISAFPHKVCGFVNMDGVPYPFHVAKSGFMFAASLYRMYTKIIWTGLFRPFIAMGLDKVMREKLTSKGFGIEYIVAQLNQTRFFGNIGLEMVTMMDLCEFGTVAWGVQDIAKLDLETVDVRFEIMLCFRCIVGTVDFSVATLKCQ
jgi:pimeloyl-ACP methyl ester carboxylesterase